jgi:hypothetical protein
MKIACLHPIIYVAHIGRKPTNSLPVVPEDELVSPLLMDTLGGLPKSLEQFAFGYEYYRQMMTALLTDGYKLLFQYDDDIATPIPIGSYLDGQQKVTIHLFCSETTDSISLLRPYISSRHNDHTAYIVKSKEEAKLLNLPHTTIFSKGIFDFLYDVTIHILGRENGMFCVPIENRTCDRRFSFKATHPNTFLLQSIYGNWNFPFSVIGVEKIAQDSHQAIIVKDNFDRQHLLVEQIDRINEVEKNAVSLGGEIEQVSDELRAPLILSIPFISHDLNQLFMPQTDEERIMSRSTKKILKEGQTHNYTINGFGAPQGIDSQIWMMSQLGTMNQILDKFNRFIDIVSQLHASFRNSPCLRLPMLGNDINKELSFVSPKINEKLVSAKNRKAVGKVMTDVGKIIDEHCLSKEARNTFKALDRQLVAISDLPVEWMPIDDIPLSFSHDVCRIPLTHVHSTLMHYALNTFGSPATAIPEDVIKHTLVVYGSNDENFSLYQNECDKLKDKLGFHTARCNSVQEFVHAVKEFGPYLLVIDTHGNTDLKQHQTYIMMGEERLYPADIAKYEIKTKLVFLSACNTAPTYNMVNTIANAFFEMGAASVVSSYMPIEVSESSTLYLRLLRQLSVAQTAGIFRNWLGFVSDLLRTSFLFSAYSKYESRVNSCCDKKNIDILKYRILIKSFANRRSIFYNLRSGKTVDGAKVSIDNIIPHYLMYSILGRADLVEFESFRKNIEISEIYG